MSGVKIRPFIPFIVAIDCFYSFFSFVALTDDGVPRSNKHVNLIPQGERNGTNGTARDHSVVPFNGPVGCKLRMPSLGSSIPRLALASFDHSTGDGHSIMTRTDEILHDRPKPRINLR